MMKTTKPIWMPIQSLRQKDRFFLPEQAVLRPPDTGRIFSRRGCEPSIRRGGFNGAGVATAAFSRRVEPHVDALGAGGERFDAFGHKRL